MSFSSRRRNYLLTPHRRDGLVEWMKKMLMHSFVLDCLEATGSDTFSHFEMLIEEHRIMEMEGSTRPSRLKQLVPTVGTFHTRLPLRQAFELYNKKHHLTKRKHIQISFNEVRNKLLRGGSSSCSRGDSVLTIVFSLFSCSYVIFSILLVSLSVSNETCLTIRSTTSYLSLPVTHPKEIMAMRQTELDDECCEAWIEASTKHINSDNLDNPKNDAESGSGSRRARSRGPS